MKTIHYPDFDLMRRVPSLMESPPERNCRLATCFHEAGHAVAMLKFNTPIHYAEVWGDSSGIVVPIKRKQSTEHREAEKRQLDSKWRWNKPADWCPTHDQHIATIFAAIAYAGQQAELLLFKTPYTGVLHGNSKDDQAAREILREAFGPSGLGPAHYSQRLARAVLAKEWPAVKRIAQALDERGHLDGSTLTSLYRHQESPLGPS